MLYKLFFALIFSSLLTACVTSPTGRSQFIVPDAQIDQKGIQAFNKIKQSTPVTHNTRYTSFVNCVAQNITRQVGGSWEVVVFENKELNAFALPGNKIGVYTGLVNLVDNQDQLATVIGHEIGHVQAQHSNERASQESVTQMGMSVLQAVIPQTQTAVGQLGVSALAQYGLLLPFSRTQESEADTIGLELMAKSGFNPQQSINLWQKMAQASYGQAPPEFMSTHPADSTRISKLTQIMPGALQQYQQAQAAGKKPACTK